MSDKKPVESKVTIDTSTDRIKGTVSLDSGVVATIAGLAAQSVDGVHSLGKSRLFSFGDDPARGVGAEVGEKQAALDLEVVVEYGHNIADVSGEIRTRIAEQVAKMAGREVVEINIDVIDIKLPEEPKPEKKSRVE
jgi:uncharacterized alkaline shock family protein YloU